MTLKPINRRNFACAMGLGTLGLAAPAVFPEEKFGAQEMLLYVGTYTRGKSEGIYIYRFNPANGALQPAGVAKGIVSPSFLALDRKQRFLYAVNETSPFAGKQGGGLTAFAIERKTGELRKLNEQSAPGVPCHVSVHPSGKWVLAANYGGGNVVLYPVQTDGSLGAVRDVAQHTGKGADPKRQDSPHAHCIMLDAAGKYAFAPDLGIDKVMIYKLETRQGKFLPHGAAATKPGAGPRHFAFHPNGKFACVINELNSTLTLFAYDKAQGSLQELHTLSTLPADFQGTSFCADVHFHPSGRFVYGSNRGHDSIVAFAVDTRAGKLTLIGHESTQGKWPRNFALDPTGQYLLAANQNTDNVAVLRIDQQTGKLTATGQTAEIPVPVCLKFLA